MERKQRRCKRAHLLQVHELAGFVGPDKQKEVSLRHAKLCLHNGQDVDAITILATYGTPLSTASYEVCSSLLKSLLGSFQKYSSIIQPMQEIQRVLVELSKPIFESPSSSFATEWSELKGLCIVTTYIYSCIQAQARGLQEMVAKVCISILRYPSNIPSDKAFYEAGIACKKVGWHSMAFVYLNCYLDIAEAIDTQDDEIVLDISGLESSNILQNISIPKQHLLCEKSREEVRDWVIQISVDQQVEPGLPSRSCDQCDKSVDAASVTCFSCKFRNEECCVTGYPVLQHMRVTCKSCGMPANRTDWNSFVECFEHCPWCQMPQKPEF